MPGKIWRVRVGCDSLRGVGHGQADAVSAGHGEEQHDDGEGRVVGEQGRKVVVVPDVTQHDEGDEDNARDHQRRKQPALLWGLGGGERESDSEREGQI